MSIVSKDQAKLDGLPKYFTGRPCKHGHVAYRWTYNSMCCACCELWQQSNKEKVRAAMRAAYRANPEKYKQRTRARYLKHKARYAENNRLWIKANRERRRRVQKLYAQRNRAKRHQDAKDRYSSDLSYRLSLCLRNRLNIAVRNKAKGGSAVRDLGCSIKHFIIYIEKQFRPGMTWKNWSREVWHLDHIKPLAWFDLSDPFQFRQAAHYTNYQPLWARENYSKGARGKKLLEAA